MQQLLKQAYNKDDVLVLSKVAKIVREDIFNSSGFQFNGSFNDNANRSPCQKILSV